MKNWKIELELSQVKTMAEALEAFLKRNEYSDAAVVQATVGLRQLGLAARRAAKLAAGK